MFCSKCGQQCPDSSAFCPSCGGAVQAAQGQVQQSQPFQQQGGSVYGGTQQELTGLGGWLILVGIGLVWGVIGGFMNIFTGFGIWAYAGFLKGIAFELVNLINLVLCGFTVFLFFTKSRKFPTVFIVLLVVGSVTGIINVIILGSTLSSALGRGNAAVEMGASAGMYGGLAFNIIFAVIFIVYTLKSRRVKNTFVN